MKLRIKNFAFVALLVALTACSGGSKSAPVTEASVSVNDADTQQSVQEVESQDNVDGDDVASTQASQSEKLVVLDFFATWCGPCKAMAPAMEKMEKKYGDRIEFRKVDVDQESELANQYNITAVPTLIVITADGKILDRMEGSQTEGELDKMFNALL